MRQNERSVRSSTDQTLSSEDPHPSGEQTPEVPKFVAEKHWFITYFWWKGTFWSFGFEMNDIKEPKDTKVLKHEFGKEEHSHFRQGKTAKPQMF